MEHHKVVVIGSGFAGLGMAIKLKEQGEEDYVVLERGDEVGGTWRDNSYPGAACDVPSRLYSFSFAPNAEWTRSFSPQPEILAYLKRCADQFGVRPKIRLGTTATKATWSDDDQRWTIETTAGPLQADVVIAAAGSLSDPRFPDIPGVEDFEGKRFHSAAWDHAHDLSGERVAVIGTGASSIQIVPKIQPQVASLKVFQRTPAWIIPRTDRDFTRLEKEAYKRLPALQRLAREAIYWSRELYVIGFTRALQVMKVPEAISRRHLKTQVPDPELRRKLTPNYKIGCKRILISNDFYPALSAPNADVVTEKIERITAKGVVTADGVEHEVDTIVFATGFQVTPPPVADAIVGRDGRSLQDVWKEGGMQALRGTTVAGFPNLFFLVGPNTGLGHTSMVYIIEAQIRYVLEALRAMKERRVATVEARPEAQKRWNDEVQRQLQGSVWQTGGCASWYLDQHGNNVTLWPDFTFRFKAETSTFDPAEYETVPA